MKHYDFINRHKFLRPSRISRSAATLIGRSRGAPNIDGIRQWTRQYPARQGSNALPVGNRGQFSQAESVSCACHDGNRRDAGVPASRSRRRYVWPTLTTDIKRCV